MKRAELLLWIVPLLAACRSADGAAADGAAAEKATAVSGAAANGAAANGAKVPCLAADHVEGNIEFVWNGQAQSKTIDALLAAVPAEDVQVDDPYYDRSKRFRALPLVAVAEWGFGRKREELSQAQFVLIALDGYRTPIDGARLLVPEAYVAFRDLDHGAWQPIGPRGADPGPLYVVWRGPDRKDTDRYPHPWALSRIEANPSPPDLSRTIPQGGLEADPKVAAGHALFTRRCLHCHSIHRQGAHVGPDLAAPRNVLDYRDEAFVREFIVNPASFRYGNMLPNPDLTKGDLDSLIAYLRALQKSPPPATSGDQP